MSFVQVIQSGPCMSGVAQSAPDIMRPNVSRADLMRYSVTLGGISGRKVSHRGRPYYRELVNMALRENSQGEFVISDDYRYAQSSFKTALSFNMGMIAAKAVAEKRYGISLLMHLDDARIAVCPSKGRRPDFFGVSQGKNGKALLVEAKGTWKEKPDSSTIEKATEQLGRIIGVCSQGKSYIDLERHVICSGFDNGILTFYDIDPPAVDGETLEIDLDKAAALYYEHVFNAVSGAERNQDSLHLAKGVMWGLDYYTIDEGDVTLGIERGVYETLAEVMADGRLDESKKGGLFGRLQKAHGEIESQRMKATGSNGEGQADGAVTKESPEAGAEGKSAGEEGAGKELERISIGLDGVMLQLHSSDR